MKIFFLLCFLINFSINSSLNLTEFKKPDCNDNLAKIKIDCNKFYKCIKNTVTGNYEAKIFTCNDNEYFDSKNKRCVVFMENFNLCKNNNFQFNTKKRNKKFSKNLKLFSDKLIKSFDINLEDSKKNENNFLKNSQVIVITNLGNSEYYDDYFEKNIDYHENEFEENKNEKNSSILDDFHEKLDKIDKKKEKIDTITTEVTTQLDLKLITENNIESYTKKNIESSTEKYIESSTEKYIESSTEKYIESSTEKIIESSTEKNIESSNEKKKLNFKDEEFFNKITTKNLIEKDESFDKKTTQVFNLENDKTDKNFSFDVIKSNKSLEEKKNYFLEKHETVKVINKKDEKKEENSLAKNIEIKNETLKTSETEEKIESLYKKYENSITKLHKIVNETIYVTNNITYNSYTNLNKQKNVFFNNITTNYNETYSKNNNTQILKNSLENKNENKNDVEKFKVTKHELEDLSLNNKVKENFLTNSFLNLTEKNLKKVENNEEISNQLSKSVQNYPTIKNDSCFNVYDKNLMNGLKPIGKIYETHHIVKTLFSVNTINLTETTSFVRKIKKNVTKIISSDDLDKDFSFFTNQKDSTFIINENHEIEKSYILENSDFKLENNTKKEINLGKKMDDFKEPDKHKLFENENLNLSSIQNFTKPNIICEKEGFFKEKESCNKFYLCKLDKNNHFSKQDFTCVEGQFFDAEKNVCVYQNMIDCKKKVLINESVKNFNGKQNNFSLDNYPIKKISSSNTNHLKESYEGLKIDLKTSKLSNDIKYLENKGLIEETNFKLKSNNNLPNTEKNNLFLIKEKLDSSNKKIFEKENQVLNQKRIKNANIHSAIVFDDPNKYFIQTRLNKFQNNQKINTDFLSFKNLQQNSILHSNYFLNYPANFPFFSPFPNFF